MLSSSLSVILDTVPLFHFCVLYNRNHILFLCISWALNIEYMLNTRSGLWLLTGVPAPVFVVCFVLFAVGSCYIKQCVAQAISQASRCTSPAFPMESEKTGKSPCGLGSEKTVCCLMGCWSGEQFSCALSVSGR